MKSKQTGEVMLVVMVVMMVIVILGSDRMGMMGHTEIQTESTEGAKPTPPQSPLVRGEALNLPCFSP